MPNQDDDSDEQDQVQNDIKKVKGNSNVVVSSQAPALPGIVMDDYCYRLIDLFNSDFKMPESDKDF